MTKLAVTGLGGIFGAALLSTMLMIANSPARSIDEVETAPVRMEQTGTNAGRITLNFETPSQTVDRR